MKSYLKQYIDGAWVESEGGTRHEVIDPATEQPRHRNHPRHPAPMSTRRSPPPAVRSRLLTDDGGGAHRAARPDHRGI